MKAAQCTQSCFLLLRELSDLKLKGRHLAANSTTCLKFPKFPSTYIYQAAKVGTRIIAALMKFGQALLGLLDTSTEERGTKSASSQKRFL
jgi:hypothetical protein